MAMAVTAATRRRDALVILCIFFSPESCRPDHPWARPHCPGIVLRLGFWTETGKRWEAGAAQTADLHTTARIPLIPMAFATLLCLRHATSDRRVRSRVRKA
jgi:hypothetical protein